MRKRDGSGWSTQAEDRPSYCRRRRSDGGAPDSRKVWELYKAKNINVVSDTRPGNHEWQVWRPALRDFAMKVFQ